jgi:hypothetical protein
MSSRLPGWDSEKPISTIRGRVRPLSPRSEYSLARCGGAWGNAPGQRRPSMLENQRMAARITSDSDHLLSVRFSTAREKIIAGLALQRARRRRPASRLNSSFITVDCDAQRTFTMRPVWEPLGDGVSPIVISALVVFMIKICSLVGDVALLGDHFVIRRAILTP